MDLQEGTPYLRGYLKNTRGNVGPLSKSVYLKNVSRKRTPYPREHPLPKRLFKYRGNANIEGTPYLRGYLKKTRGNPYLRYYFEKTSRKRGCHIKEII